MAKESLSILCTERGSYMYMDARMRAKSLQFCLTLCNLHPTRLLCPRDSPGKNTVMGFCDLLQGLFPTQRWNCVSLGLLHWKVCSLPLASLVKPYIYIYICVCVYILDRYMWLKIHILILHSYYIQKTGKVPICANIIKFSEYVKWWNDSKIIPQS